jgi:Sulfotransferase domain
MAKSKRKQGKIVSSKPSKAVKRIAFQSVSPARPRMVLCAGLKSSGSTWLYNVVAEILKQAQPRPRSKSARSSSKKIRQFYADNGDDFPPDAERAAALVVKTHMPSRSVRFAVAVLEHRVLLSVREPRDAIASVMQRFGHRFDGALKEVTIGASRMVDFANMYDPLIFRFEERFYDRPDTVSQLADFLGVQLSRSALKKIFDAHTRVQIQKRITALKRRGVFGRTPDPDRFDAETHWHPGHVGNMVIGKYHGTLTAKQQRAVLTATKDFCERFGYPLEPSPSPRSRSIRRAAS